MMTMVDIFCCQIILQKSLMFCPVTPGKMQIKQEWNSLFCHIFVLGSRFILCTFCIENITQRLIRSLTYINVIPNPNVSSVSLTYLVMQWMPSLSGNPTIQIIIRHHIKLYVNMYVVVNVPFKVITKHRPQRGICMNVTLVQTNSM